jgi:hypothetical protein
LQPDVLDLLPRPANAVNDRRLADDVDHAHPRIERRIGILEDHLHLELLRARRLGGEADERSPAPVARAGRRSEQADRDAPERRLAATGFADQPHDFAGCNREIDRVHGMHHFFADARAMRLPMRVETSSGFTNFFDTPRSSTSGGGAIPAFVAVRVTVLTGDASGCNGWWQRAACPMAPIGRVSGAAAHTSVA